MPFPDAVPLADSALLVIDVQDSFKYNPARWERRNNRDFERNVGALVEAYRAAGLPVVFIMNHDSDPGFVRGSPHYKLMDFLQMQEGEPLFEKSVRNSFTTTHLGPYLMEKGVRRLAVTGIQMEQCCETTTRVAADLGYAVDFVIDGTLTFPIPNPDVPGEELGVAAIEERTTYALRGRFARVVKTQQLLGELAALKRSAA
jgi:nicotinamidase-related amidase